MSRARFTLPILLLVVGSCRGCESDGAPERQPAEELPGGPTGVTARLQQRALDRTKTYPKDASGRVTCGADLDCFLVQAEQCTPATLDHVLALSGYGVEQRIAGSYRISGSEAGRCKVEREILELEVTLEPAMVEALRKQGKPEDFIEKIRTDGLEGLRRQHPKLLACWFSKDQLLMIMLDLGDSKESPSRWRLGCREAVPPPTGAPAPQPAPAATK